MADLKGNEPQVEGAKATPKVEETKPTPKEAIPSTLGVKTYSEDDFQRELDKRVGKGLASTNQQLSTVRAEAERAKAEVERHKAERQQDEARLREADAELQRVISQIDDPETKALMLNQQRDRVEQRRFADMQAQVAQQRTKAEQAAEFAYMTRRQVELSQETGIPIAELEKDDCNSEADMVKKAYSYKLAQFEQKPEKTEGEQSFDSGVSTGGGEGKLTAAQVAKMSPDERFARRNEIAKMPLI